MPRKRITKRYGQNLAELNSGVSIAIVGILVLCIGVVVSDPIEIPMLALLSLLCIVYVILALDYLANLCLGRLADLDVADRTKYIRSGWSLLGAAVIVGIILVSTAP